jgi:hypothetical protein
VIAQHQKDFDCVNLASFNVLHWIILSRRDDLFSFVMDNYFKAGAKTQASNSLIPAAPAPQVEPQVLFSCLRGGQGFKIIGYEGEKAESSVFAYQIKGAGPTDGLEVEFSEEVSQSRMVNYQFQIDNLGFALIILTKNSKFLKQLLKLHPNIFMNSVLSGALYSSIK